MDAVRGEVRVVWVLCRRLDENPTSGDIVHLTAGNAASDPAKHNATV